ncbi:MAG: hypothetical protein IPK80_00995 [Nannocystis sp.]|nr:hypothetical protein [Nannocystis sp.]
MSRAHTALVGAFSALTGIQGPRWSQINLQAYTLTYEPAPDALQRRPERLAA